MSRVWDTSKHPPKPFLDLCRIKVIQSQKVKLKALGLVDVMYVLGLFFFKNAKVNLEHFLNGQNRTQFENQKNTEVPGNRVISTRFEI